MRVWLYVNASACAVWALASGYAVGQLCTNTFVQPYATVLATVLAALGGVGLGGMWADAVIHRFNRFR